MKRKPPLAGPPDPLLAKGSAATHDRCPGPLFPLQPPLCLLLRLWNSRRRPRPGQVVQRASRITRHSLPPCLKFSGALEFRNVPVLLERGCQNLPLDRHERDHPDLLYRSRAAHFTGPTVAAEAPTRNVTWKTILIRSISNHLGCSSCCLRSISVKTQN